MFKVYFEDIEVGDTAEFGSYEVTKDEIIEFASKYDPQPFHLSDDFAKHTPLGGLCASGWHTSAMMMSMIVAQMKAVGLASLGSPGVDNLKWLAPVRPGDILGVKQTIDEKIPSKSRPDLGIVRIHHYEYTRQGTLVLDMISTVMVACRPKEAEDE